MEAILFAFIACFGWGVGDVFRAIASRKLGSVQAAFWSYVTSILVFTLIAIQRFGELGGLTTEILALNIFLGLILLIGSTAFYEGLRSNHPSLVGTIAASFVSIVVILSVIFLEERINPFQIVAIVIISVGLILTMLDFKKLKDRKFSTSRGMFFSLIAMLFWGIYFTFIKIPVKEIGWFWPSYISYMLFPLLFLFMKIKKNNFFSSSKVFIPIILAVILTGVADFSYNFGISKALNAIVAPIAGSYPIIFVVLSLIFFKDRLKKQQIFGIALTLFGIIFLLIASA